MLDRIPVALIAGVVFGAIGFILGLIPAAFWAAVAWGFTGIMDATFTLPGFEAVPFMVAFKYTTLMFSGVFAVIGAVVGFIMGMSGDY